ncbi:magnesium transporter [Ekhidna sp. To15]|uniref:magnesium transporter n=1 Tax=Ekhidna sp. To15 TaxID=3395267 RepID=UPI003F5249D2
MELTEIKSRLVDKYIQLFPEEVAATFNAFSPEEIVEYLKDLPSDATEELLTNLSPDVVASVIESMEESAFLSVFDAIDPYLAAKLLSRTKSSLLEKRLGLFSERKSKSIREMLSYPPEAAGFLMDTRIITFQPENTVDQVLNKLRSIGDKKMVNLYVTDSKGRLLGKVFIQTIAISTPETTLDELVVPCESVSVMSPAEEVVKLFEEGKIINLPVVDIDNHILGIIRNSALVAATQKDASEDVLAMFGAGREERALSTPLFAVKKRLPWLQINLATAFLAASIVGAFEETIAQVTVLAVFLPVVAGQSGNTGSQALAVTMRGLALREIQTSQWWKVARKEVAVGFINGIAVALTTSVIAYFWASSFGISLVIGTSMILSMVIAGFSGAVVPIILKAFGQDPAQSSSIVLTTVTDIMGFLSFLGLATLLGSALGIF